MKKQDVLSAIDTIRAIIDREVSTSSPEEVLQKLNDLSQVSGLSGEIIARAKRLYNESVQKQVGELFNMKHQDRKMMIDTRCIDEIELVDICTGLNKDLHYSIEACRSMLSYIKNEMQTISRN